MEIVQSIVIGKFEVVCGARCCGHYIVLYCDLIRVQKNVQIKVWLIQRANLNQLTSLKCFQFKVYLAYLFVLQRHIQKLSRASKMKHSPKKVTRYSLFKKWRSISDVRPVQCETSLQLRVFTRIFILFYSFLYKLHLQEMPSQDFIKRLKDRRLGSVLMWAGRFFQIFVNKLLNFSHRTSLDLPWLH